MTSITLILKLQGDFASWGEDEGGTSTQNYTGWQLGSQSPRTPLVTSLNIKMIQRRLGRKWGFSASTQPVWRKRNAEHGPRNTILTVKININQFTAFM